MDGVRFGLLIAVTILAPIAGAFVGVLPQILLAGFVLRRFTVTRKAAAWIPVLVLLPVRLVLSREPGWHVWALAYVFAGRATDALFDWIDRRRSRRAAAALRASLTPEGEILVLTDPLPDDPPEKGT